MLFVVLLGCAPEVTAIGLCGPSGRFVLPEPDLVVLDADRDVHVEVLVTCTDLAPRVAWARGDGRGEGEVALDCTVAGETTRCVGALPTDELAACSGEGAWTTLHLLVGGDDSAGATELDEVGIPFAGGVAAGG